MLKRYTDILTKYGLEAEFNYIRKYNKSNKLPYHNLGHALQVMYAVEKIFWTIHSKSDANLIKCRNMLIAALFHDFNHSGGKHSDDVNINRAIDGLEEFSKYTGSDICVEIYSYIEATQFPYVNVLNIDKIYIDIMRDADLTQLTVPEYEKYALGLIDENYSKGATMEDYIIKFNDNHEYILPASRKLFSQLRENNINKLRVKYENQE
jgi:hypothetical protein